MARLAEYLADLSVLLGQQESVHFLRVDEGSANLVHVIDPPAQPKVIERVRELHNGGGPLDARKAFRRIDERLVSDNATARLTGAENSILDFPGRNRTPPATFGPFNQIGELTGLVIALGGKKELVPVMIQDGEQIYNCRASRDLARKLAQHLFLDPIRVSGTGRWFRDQDGEWMLRGFRVSDFKTLNPSPLTETLAQLRDVHRRSDWSTFEDPIEELEDIRDGRGKTVAW